MIDVLASGAIRLGSNVVCDGYVEGCLYRIQTHIHEDHMSEFNKSKGFQDILMSPGTHALIIAERNAELPYRDNLHQVRNDEEHQLDDGSKVFLVSSNHMLGACQVIVELPNSHRIGYSGDFGWPLEKVIQVDELVVDSTYGSPRSIRRYTQADAENCLREVLNERLRHGPVNVYAHRGTIERVVQILGGSVDVPIVASEQLIREVRVYQEFGFAICDIDDIGSEVGQSAVEERSYVRLYSKGDGLGNEPQQYGSSIVCSAFMVNRDHPLMKYSDRAYRIALSNHADFNETLEYISATGAKKVVTDNTRNHGRELAQAIQERFPNVAAYPSTNKN